MAGTDTDIHEHLFWHLTTSAYFVQTDVASAFSVPAVGAENQPGPHHPTLEQQTAQGG
ncbi:hypothetical protein ACQ856_24185 [Mycolicibacterium psychrotolerans]|uniref:hypothetical protein n=1 Tax=Mycolicibacterium psychrotolerans TaxID=216929 RepID=UPI003D665107